MKFLISFVFYSSHTSIKMCPKLIHSFWDLRRPKNLTPEPPLALAHSAPRRPYIKELKKILKHIPKNYEAMVDIEGYERKQKLHRNDEPFEI